MKAKSLACFVITAVLVTALPRRIRAHCDTMDGPVVTAAKLALEKADVTGVLKWVKKDDEAGIRSAFAKTLVVRKQSAEAKELADLYFYETLVRIHRAGEGEPYSGLKPHGTPVELEIAAADKAIASGNVDDLLKSIPESEAAEVRRKFQRVIETRKHADESIEAGREYVAAYVQFIHHAEQGEPAADADTQQALEKLERDWANAVKRRDVETIARIQADGFQFTGPAGEIWTKARGLDSIRAGNLEIVSFELSEFKAWLYGGTAVVSFRVVWNGNSNGMDISGPQRMTDVFVKHDGRWQCVASHTTRIAQQ